MPCIIATLTALCRLLSLRDAERAGNDPDDRALSSAISSSMSKSSGRSGRAYSVTTVLD